MSIFWFFMEWRWQLAALLGGFACFSIMSMQKGRYSVVKRLLPGLVLLPVSFAVHIPQAPPGPLRALLSTYTSPSDVVVFVDGFGLYFLLAFAATAWAPVSYFRRKRVLWRTLALYSLLGTFFFLMGSTSTYVNAQVSAMARLASSDTALHLKCPSNLDSSGGAGRLSAWIDTLASPHSESAPVVLDRLTCLPLYYSGSVSETALGALSHGLAHLGTSKTEEDISCTGFRAREDLARLLGLTVDGSTPQEFTCAPSAVPDQELLRRLADFPPNP